MDRQFIIDIRLGRLMHLLLIAVGIRMLCMVPAWKGNRLPPVTPVMIDPNVATVAELRLLPTIGPRRAAVILDHRTKWQSSDETRDSCIYESAESLHDIPGIGPVTITRIASYLTFAACDANLQESDVTGSNE